MSKKIRSWPYRIFSNGDILSIRSGKILKPFPITTDRRLIKSLQVELWKDGKMRRVLVHRLVFSTMVRPLLPTEDVHHLDLDPSNNDVSNLIALDHAEHTRMHKLGLL